MKFGFLLSFLFVVLLCNAQPVSMMKYNVDNLSVQWEVVENNHKGKTEFLSAFTFTNKNEFFPNKGWSLFFNFPRMIQSGTVTGGVTIHHINGDFYQLSPTAGFKGLKANESIRIEFVSGAWGVSISDAPAGLYIVWDNAPEKGELLSNYTVKPST